MVHLAFVLLARVSPRRTPAPAVTAPARSFPPAVIAGRAFLRALAAVALAATAAIAATAVTPAAAAVEPAPSTLPSDSLFALAERLFRAGAADSTLRLVAPIAARAAAAGDAGLELPARLHQASACCVTGRTREGEAAARRALGLARAAGDSARARMALRWLAYALLSQGRDAEGAARYHELLDLSAAAGDRREEAYARLGLAFRDLTAGDAGTAIDGYHRAIALFTAVGETAMALDSEVGLARTYAREGRYEEMRRLYEHIIVQAQRLAEAEAGARGATAAGAEHGAPPGAALSNASRIEAFALNNLAGYESEAGDPQLAVAHWQRALAILRALGDLRTQVTPSLNLAAARLELGEFGTAVAELEDLARRCEQEGYLAHRALVLVELGSTRAASGLAEEAAAAWREVLATDEAPLEARAEALQLLALACERRGDPAAALALLDREAPPLLPRLSPDWRAELALARAAALAALGRCDAALGPAGLGAGGAAGGAPGAGSAAGGAAPIPEALAAAGTGGFQRLAMRARLQQARCELALGASDSALAHLRLAQRAWDDLRAVPRDPRWREQRGSLGGEIHLELARLLLSHPPTAPPAERARAAFDALQRFKARTLLERMLGPDAFTAGQAASPPPIVLVRLQADVLRDGDLLLDFYLGDDGSLLLAARRDTCAVVALPRRRVLTDLASLYHELVATPPAAGAGAAEPRVLRERAAARLEHELFGAVAPLVQSSRRVILCPDGPLNRLPLEQLPLLAGREAFRAPSATLYGRLAAAGRPRAGSARARTRGPARAGLLALSARDLSPDQRLPGAEAEVRWLRRTFRQVAVTAGLDGLPALAAGREVLHVAAHTDAYDERPWNSRVVLGIDAEGRPRGLEASDIAALRLDPRLAVISGCESAGGRVLSGEGVLGLTGAFLSAGARAAVVSLWPVDDGATWRLMRHFYRELAAGRSVAGALSRAQSALAAEPETADPFYWAGFVAVGDGGLAVALEPRMPAILKLLALAGLALLAFAAGWVLFRRRRL